MMLQLVIVVVAVMVIRTNGIPLISCLFAGCQQGCRNELLGYVCICNPGYSVDPNNHKKCIVARADCKAGLEPNPNKLSECQDINECNQGKCDQLCSNNYGSYTCSCRSGYKLDPQNRNRCIVERPACNPGYQSTSSGCVDINECETTAPCDHSCRNTKGSYRCACREGYEVSETNRNKCNKIQICNALADIIIVLDSSGSMQEENNELQLTFASRFINHFQVGTSNARFGGIIFSDIPERVFDLITFLTTREAAEGIRRAPYHGGTTRTDLAFDFIRNDKMFSTAKGGRDRAIDIAVVFTDGQSTRPELTPIAAEKLKNANVKIIAVGIGKEVSLPELREIASSDQDVFEASSFEDLDYIEQKLSTRVCKSAS